MKTIGTNKINNNNKLPFDKNNNGIGKKILLSMILSISILNAADVRSYFLNNNEINNNQTVKKEHAVAPMFYKEQKKVNPIQEQQALLLKKKIEELKKEIQNKKQRLSFNIKEKVINVKKNGQWIKIFIPVGQISELDFDKPIKEIETMANPLNKIIFNKKNPKVIKFENKDFNLQQYIKVKFVDGKILNILLQVGDEPSKRHISYKIYANPVIKALLPEFQKKLKIKNLQDYFNNVAIKLITDRILLDKDFEIIRKNMIVINKKIFEGYGIVNSITGKTKIKYSVTLNNVFRTPYVKNYNFKYNVRLQLNELTITNLSNDKILVISDNFIKNRFPNYVAFYIGDIKKQENYLQPGKSLRILVVTAEKEPVSDK